MMAKRNSVPIRSDPKMKKFLEDIRLKRIKADMDKPKDLTDRELTRMLMNTEGIKKCKMEMLMKKRRII